MVMCTSDCRRKPGWRRDAPDFSNFDMMIMWSTGHLQHISAAFGAAHTWSSTTREGRECISFMRISLSANFVWQLLVTPRSTEIRSASGQGSEGAVRIMNRRQGREAHWKGSSMSVPREVQFCSTSASWSWSQ